MGQVPQGLPRHRLVAVAAAAACACGSTGGDPDAPREPAEDRTYVASNILRADYAGSEACRDCHEEVYRAWHGSPMRRMTRRAAMTDVRAPFDGAVYTFKGDRVTLETHDGERYMRMVTAEDGERLYRITKVIGGRTREDFVGVRVVGDDPSSRRTQGHARVMPVSFVYGTESLRYKGYSVMGPERPGLRAGSVWRRTCILCHNTAPLLTGILDDVRGPGARSYAGSISDDLLPASRAWRYEVTDEAGLRRAVSAEIRALSGAAIDPETTPLETLLDDAILAARRNMDTEHLLEVGIGCEACHGGAAQHADDPDFLPSFRVRSPVVAFGPPEPRRVTRAEAINRACARCHTVLFSQYEHTWEGGARDRDPGGSNINSGEARDFLLGGCATEMSCADCHDPHARDDTARLARLATPAGNATCTRCHGDYAGDAALRAHSHHDPNGAGGACVACHMANKNMSLGYELTRYHRIGSPTDRARVERDRPLECALCHPDDSVETLVTAMEEWWGGDYDRGALRELYGDLDARPLDVTLARGKPHEQVVAAAVLGETRRTRAAGAVAELLTHELPLIRFWARHALEQMLGEPVDIDVERDPAAIRADVASRSWR